MEEWKPESRNKNEFPAAVAVCPDLPGDVMPNIIQWLGISDILEGAEKVCTTWRRVCLDPAMWRDIQITYNDYCRCNKSYGKTTAMCQRAVDRSQGQLVDLTIENFCGDGLLHYIVDRSSDLKRLTLQACHDLTEKGMVEAVKKLPHLEELHLIIKPSVKAADIINIGTSCPVLKSFTFNQYGFCSPSSNVSSLVPSRIKNAYAFAIAKSMPNLCHLRLIANSIGAEGLEAILDGCPNLESLDLRQCFHLELRRALGKRCCEQIKHFKFPSDSVSSIEYLRAPKCRANDYGFCPDIEYFDDLADYGFCSDAEYLDKDIYYFDDCE